MAESLVDPDLDGSERTLGTLVPTPVSAAIAGGTFFAAARSTQTLSRSSSSSTSSTDARGDGFDSPTVGVREDMSDDATAPNDTPAGADLCDLASDGVLMSGDTLLGVQLKGDFN
ncbi:hypothetical protein C8F04DRAFT_1189563 [Mycena alexandri]|uniref:Uncharacterized protein n=1 Tax=Mycena alexandri TaxID=1745969 RepID=A0AAD6SH60_9AGAR|nr:hypothetical protein C8F04DRAFT_1189563 [Mycena alexandri]